MRTLSALFLISGFACSPIALAQPQQAPRHTRPSAGSDPDVNAQIVDALVKRYGDHPGFRTNHAKGILAEGTFVPTSEARGLTRSPIFAGPAVPITARFSDAGGMPHLPDASALANPHGMSIKFHLPGGVDSDIVTNALKFFTVATAEDFRDLQLAGATSPPGQPRSAQFQAFLDSHPAVEKANATLGNPASFADEQYFGIDAFIFIDQVGTRQAFRYIISPEKVVHLGKEEAAAKSADYLTEDLLKRVAQGPVIFHLRPHFAAPGDPTHDATIAWPDDRKVVDLGTLTLTKIDGDSENRQKKLLFTPGRLTDGIEPSDDPLIAARDGSYAISFRRRSPQLTNDQFKKEAEAREKQDLDARSPDVQPPK